MTEFQNEVHHRAASEVREEVFRMIAHDLSELDHSRGELAPRNATAGHRNSSTHDLSDEAAQYTGLSAGAGSILDVINPS